MSGSEENLLMWSWEWKLKTNEMCLSLKYVCFFLSTDGESYSSTQDTPTRAGKSKWTLQRFLPEIHSLSEREDAEWESVA